MSERIIKVEPFKTHDDIIRLSGTIGFPGVENEISIPESRTLNLFNYEIGYSDVIVPRDFNNFHVNVQLGWRPDSNLAVLGNIIMDSENPDETLALRIQAICEKTRWCSEQRKVQLSTITKRTKLDFTIPLQEVSGIIKVVGFITREIEAKNKASILPTSSLSIVSTCRELSIQVDEVREIGGEYLPIGPGNIGELAFDIQGLDDAFDLPRIIYSEELKDYLTRDDMPSVNASILTGLLCFLDQYLKWLVFVCRLDYNDKRHKSIIEMFSNFCNVSKDDLIAIVEKQKFSSEQSISYFDLSKRLFKGIQTQNKYKRELKNLFKASLK